MIENILNVFLKFAEVSFYGIMSMNLGIILSNKYSLQKNSKYEGKIILDENQILKITNNIPKEQIDIAKKEVLRPYIEKLIDSINEEDLKVVYNNLSTVKIKKIFLPLLIIGIVGTYNSIKNEISYIFKAILGHEFLHLSSSTYYKEEDIILSGFRQNARNYDIGIGINEGYTELLASRLYNKNNKIRCYRNLVKITKMIEFFFDDPKDMEHLYFNCNLPGLIKQLEQYASREEVIKLIIEMDVIKTYASTLSPISCIKNIQLQLTLYKWFRKKCKDPKKVEELKSLACKNKVVSLMLNNKKMKLYKDSPYERKQHQSRHK